MVSNLDLSTLVSQIPEAQRIQAAHAAQPEIQQALAGELTLLRQRRNGKRVRKAQSADPHSRVRDGEGTEQPALPRRPGKTAENNPAQDQGVLIDTTV